MVVQLLHEVVGTAVVVLLYSFLCLTASSIMIWLVWTHHERDSYVALLSYSTLLGTVASIIQQFHTFIWWRDVKIEQYEYIAKHLGSPEIAIAGPSVGLDLVLFYIRKSQKAQTAIHSSLTMVLEYYTYNVEAMLTLFWAIALTHTVFKLVDLTNFRHIGHRTNKVAKAVGVILPAILMSLLRLSAVQSSRAGFLVLANFNIMISLTFGSILLIAILIKYIYARHRLVSWNARYLFSRRSQETDGEILNVLDRGDGRQSIYDRWLVLRFSIAFVVLAVFQLITILLEISQLSHHTKEKIGEAPNLSAEKAKNDFLLFLPGVSTSLLVFIVFGTTRTCRKTIYKTFIPRRFQKKPAAAEPGTATIPLERVREDEGSGQEDSRGASDEGPSDIGSKNVSETTETTAETSEPHSTHLVVSIEPEREAKGGTEKLI
ncbi:hypothetical protein K449DRAFT_374214 [Hypoxylon sp. EC38]|nr:hypothetical protein K449DRAFT_374214 [Hypoxylon sp. EC38]